MRRQFQVMLSTTAAAALTFWGAPAFAQPVAEQNSASGEIGDEVQAGEIVVTAQRRAEKLKDVPISITALSSDMLHDAGVIGTADLTVAVAGLNFTMQGAFAQPTIRGIGTTVASNGNEANVAVYVDGVYQPSQNGNISNLVGIQQIEVLKGPQGTLFGRNATGGAIRITTRDPGRTFEGEVNARYGRFDEIRADAYLSTPLTESLAANVSVLYTDGGEYIRNTFTGTETSGNHSVFVRGKLLFEPNSDIKIVASGLYRTQSQPAPYALSIMDGNYVNVTRPGYIPVNDQKREISLTKNPLADYESWAGSLNASFNFGPVTLNSITSYTEADFYGTTDLDRTNLELTALDLPKNQKTFVQEFNLVSNGDSPLKWVVGAFYMDDKHTQRVITNLNLAAATRTDNNTKAMAVFGEANYTIGNFTLIAGIRYSHETKEFIFANATLSETQERTFNTWTPRVGVRYALDEHSNLYATWSRGFKSGLLDGSPGAIKTIFPEQVDAYEVGYKYGRGSTSITAALYYYDYTNVQFARFNPNAPGLSDLFNAAKQKNYGAEIEFATEITDNFKLRGALSYIHARYESFNDALIFCPKGPPAFGNAIILIGQLNPCTGKINDDGATGNKVIRTPEFTASISGNYRHELPSGHAIEVNGTVFYSTEFFWSPAERQLEPAYVMINGEIAYSFGQDRFRVSVWGKNLANEIQHLYVAESAAGDSASYTAPRTYGISMRVRF